MITRKNNNPAGGCTNYNFTNVMESATLNSSYWIFMYSGGWLHVADRGILLFTTPAGALFRFIPWD